MIKSKNGIFLFLVVLLILGCKNPSKQSKEEKLTVAVAASCQFAFRELAQVFENVEGIRVEIIAGSSGKITTQIMHGAPYDIFVAANMDYPQVLVDKKKASSEVFLYGYGIPVFWTMNPEIDLASVHDHLLSTAVEKVAIADPRNAPYGAMAVAYLKANDLYEKIEDKLVFGESISQVNEYILKRTVALGISAKSVVSVPKLTEVGSYIELDTAFFIKQGMVVVKNDTSLASKMLFLDFVLSQQGKEILKKFGYAVL